MLVFRHCLKLDVWQQATYCLRWFLAALSSARLSLGSWRLSYLLLRYCRLAEGRLRLWLLSQAGLLTTSWALRRGWAGWGLCSLLGGWAHNRGGCSLLLDCWLCLWLDVSFGHRWCHCCWCCCLCSWSWSWLHSLTCKDFNIWKELSLKNSRSANKSNL